MTKMNSKLQLLKKKTSVGDFAHKTPYLFALFYNSQQI